MILRNSNLAPLALAFLLVLAACGGPVVERHIVGPYYLVAIDSYSQTNISREASFGYHGKIPATVFAYGFDDRFIVAKVNAGTLTEPNVMFYFLDMTKDEDGLNSDEIAVGPLTQEQFESEKAAFGLPEITEIFARTNPLAD